jgi:hypothetical protein
MPKVVNLLQLFPNLGEVPIEALVSPDKMADPGFVRITANYFANCLLFPQKIPTTLEHVKFDIVVIREGLKRNIDKFYNTRSQKIFIPEEFLELFHNPPVLAMTFVEAVNPRPIAHFVSMGLGNKNLGTIIVPEIVKDGTIQVWVSGRGYNAPIGQITVIPITESRFDLQFSSDSATFLGEQEKSLEAIGGPIGLIIDARRK